MGRRFKATTNDAIGGVLTFEEHTGWQYRRPLNIRLNYDPESGQWESYCDELGVATCGDNELDAAKMCCDAIDTQIDGIRDILEGE